MVPRKKDLRIITSLVSVFTWVLARECCCLRVCREQPTGEGSTHRNSPSPGSLLSLLLSKEATPHKTRLKHQSRITGHKEWIAYTEDLSKRKKKKVKARVEINLAFYTLRIRSAEDFSETMKILSHSWCPLAYIQVCVFCLSLTVPNTGGEKNNKPKTKWHKVI